MGSFKLIYYICNMNIENKTIDELKVMAYDLLASKEQTERNLQIVNQLIAKKYEEVNSVTDDSNDGEGSNKK